MLSLKRNVNCPRRMAVYAVFDVLDRIGLPIRAGAGRRYQGGGEGAGAYQ